MFRPAVHVVPFEVGNILAQQFVPGPQDKYYTCDKTATGTGCWEL